MTPRLYAFPWRLLFDFARREVAKRYRGAGLGLLWLVLHPLLMLAIYTFVFSYVLKVKVPELEGFDRIIWLYAGLTIFFFFSDALTAATPAIRAYPTFVKKVIFPIEVLVGSKVLSAFVSLLINAGLLMTFVAVSHGGLPGSMLFAPLILLPVLVLAYGTGMVLASLGVFLRDLDEVVRIGLRVVFYLTPIVYPLTFLPETVRAWFLINPLAAVVENYRRVMVFGLPPEGMLWTVLLVSGGLALVIGHVCFQRLRPGFADVI